MTLSACSGLGPNTAEDAHEVNVTAEHSLTVDEDEETSLVLSPRGVRRFDVEGLPPGARFDTKTGTFTFRPDFTQSGSYSVVVTVHHEDDIAEKVRIEVTVRDSITPPEPTIVRSSQEDGFRRLVVRQTTDRFLDSPARAGRTFEAVVVVPDAASDDARRPVVVGLHGFGGGPNPNASSTSTFRIEPHDPDNTYWWGYGDGRPGAGPSDVQPYTLRRVLHLLDWLLRTQPGADADRVFAEGASMGGAGALVLGFMHARHFAGIESTISQTVARNHRPSRIRQLAGHWGTPEANVNDVWDRLDVTRILRDSVEARDQFVFTKHGKDDSTIHFGAVVTASPLTGKSFYRAIEDEHVGHYTVWDEGAHGPGDPVLGDRWWDEGWSRITDSKSYLTRRAPFPAFTGSSANEEAIASGAGNGRRPFDPETGYAAALATAGDTGWSGSIAGAFNRFLRWDTDEIVDTPEKLSMPLFAVGTSRDAAPPKPGYPATGDRHRGETPIVVDVTPRRLSGFRLMSGESVRYRFGSESGTVEAAADGSVTIPSLPITNEATVLELERATR